MASYVSRNESVINKAFSRLSKNKDKVIEKGMKDLLENAMLYAIGAHDHNHWFHKSTADTYGWMLLHDGVGVAHNVNEGRHGEGAAYAGLMAVSREVPQTGWVGVLLAYMGEPMYFVVEYEDEILTETRNVTKENFGLFFNVHSGPSSSIPML